MKKICRIEEKRAFEKGFEEFRNKWKKIKMLVLKF